VPEEAVDVGAAPAETDEVELAVPAAEAAEAVWRDSVAEG
jgi:hypothetical protein